MRNKEMNKKTKNICCSFKNKGKYFLILILFIIIHPVSLSKAIIKKFFIIKLNNEITITLKGTGKQFILYQWFTSMPNYIYANNELVSTSEKNIELAKGENIITMKWNSPIKDCYKMFFFLSNITLIDLSKFDTSEITNMASMFKGCSSLTSIILNNINTSSVTSMEEMFYECHSLISLKFPKIDTSNVLSMRSMFYNCIELKELYLNYFNTTSVTNINTMFYGCKSLTTLDLSNFETSYVKEMSNTFQGCESLISLNIDNFNTTNVEKMDNMFYGCKSLLSLNLNSFETSKISGIHDLLTNIGNDLIFCIDNSKTSSILSQVTGYNNDCENICFTGNKTKIVFKIKKCVFNCNDTNYIYEYKDICYEKCPNNTYVTSDNTNLCQLNPEGYYLEDNIYKPCHENCKFCNGTGNQMNYNCIECKLNYVFLNEKGKESNCYINCDNYYYFDSSDDYHCTLNDECPTEYSKIINEKKKCIDNCKNDDIYKYEYNNICYEHCPNDTYITSDNINLCQLNPEGYYLEENIYKPCYESCKFCNGAGDQTNNNCIECKLNYIFVNDSLNTNNCYINCDNYYYFDSSDDYHCTLNDECPTEYSKIINEKKKCIDNCKNDDIYKYEYNNICYEHCPNDTYITSDNINLCQLNPEGYYLEENIYKPCYESCKFCNGAGDQTNNNCIECKLNYIFLNDSLNSNNYNCHNCYKKCDYFYYFDSSNDYHCTINDECPKEYNKLIKNKNKCINNCSNDDIYRYDENNLCVQFIYLNESFLICPINTPFEKNRECIEICTGYEYIKKECTLNNKNNQTAQDNIIKNIKSDISKGNLNQILSDIKDGNDYIILDSDTTFQLTSSDNQNNYEYNNISSIILGDCENIIKQKYGINDDETLIIFKVDIINEGLKIPIVEYEIYHPVTLEKIDLDCCQDVKIGISLPVSINENSLFKYNSSDNYYNDICYSYTTENNTDIVIKDRRNEYIKNNMSLCESVCDYIEYNTHNKKVLCKCKIKGTINSITDIKNNKEILLNAFSDLKNSINLDIMKCYKKLFTKDGLIKNIGSYILLSIILIHIISIFIFLIKGYKIIYYTIQYIVKNIKINKNLKNKHNSISLNIKNNIYHGIIKKKRKDKNLKKQSTKTFNNKIYNVIRKVSNPLQKRNKIRNQNKSINDEYSSKCNMKSLSKYSENIKKSPKKSVKKIHIFNKKNNNFNINFINYVNRTKVSILNYNDYELNNLLYKEALEIDKRTYLQYYMSLLKQKQLLIFTFYTYNDYNSRIIKISLFFFSFGLYYTVNAFFFNYHTIHKIYEDQGDYNFIFQIPQILYSTLISSAISIIIKNLSLSQTNIIEIKTEKKDIDNKASKLLRCLTIKFCLFFILSFLFLLFFWYYLGCFCVVYINTQKHLIQDTIYSFILSLLYPFLLNLVPGFFRIQSLRSQKQDKECLYKFSQVIHLI